MASAVTLEIKKSVIQYIYASRSFNEVDISLVMRIMFKDKYKTDIDGKWYKNIEGVWESTNAFTIREEIGTSVSRTVADSIQFIKENQHVTYDNIHHTGPTYESVVTDLVKKRQLLRDMNKLDQALVVTQRIKKIIELPEIIKNCLTDDQLNVQTIISKMQTKAFKDAVMANLINIFYVPTN